MARPAPSEFDEEPMISVPRQVRFPVELIPPEGFDPDDPATWPDVPGRLEWVGGRLLYMPPCGGLQSRTVTDVVVLLGLWARQRDAFDVGTNEAGMRLGDDTRGADAGVWRRSDSTPHPNAFRRTPPLLAVEVAGGDEEPEAQLLAKAEWYLAHGTAVVWIVIPAERRVIVRTTAGTTRHGLGETLPSSPALPGLVARVDDLLAQTLRAR